VDGDLPIPSWTGRSVENHLQYIRGRISVADAPSLRVDIPFKKKRMSKMAKPSNIRLN